MAFFLKLLINKSNKVYNIYDSTNNYKQVGKLNPREAFVLYGGDGDFVGINFLNSSGVFTSTTIDLGRYPLPNNNGYDYPSHLFCENFPYGTIQFGTEIYQTYIMRSTQKVYHPDGTELGLSVNAGRLVASDSSTVGLNKPYLKVITHYQDASGQWQSFKEKFGLSHAFIDTGLRTASGYNKIAFYGSW